MRVMTSSTNLKLAMRLIQRSKKQPAISPNAFTLVELMVVVTIVGILSAVALPNFLSQADKAKATEAKTQITSILKQAHAKYLEDGNDPETTIANMTSNYGAPEDDQTLFNYATTAPTWADPVYTVMATANGNDGGLGTGANAKKIQGCVNFDTGFVDMGSNLATTATAVDCTP